MKKTLLYPLATFAVTACLCLLFMLVSASIPQEAIEENAKQSAEYFYETPLFQISAGSLQNFKKDNYADCISAGIAYHLNGENPYIAVLRADYNRVDGENVNQSFYRQMQGEEVSVESYSRYWHGSAGLIRILYLFMDIQTIRYVVTAVGIILHMVLVGALVRKKQTALGILYGISFLLVNGVFALECLEYAFVFILVPIASLFLLHKKIGKDPVKVQLTFLVSGVLTAFFDFLTTETLTFTIPFTIYCILVYNIKMSENDRRKTWFMFLRNGVSWVVGYGGMFLMKWLLVALSLGKDAWKVALSSATERMVGEVSLTLDTAGEKADWMERIQGVVTRNLGCLYWGGSDMQVMTVVVITLVLATVLAVFWYLARKENVRMPGAGVLTVVALIPYIRFLFLSNHSYIHYFFTYRAQMVTVLIILYLIYTTTFLSEPVKRRK